MARPFLVPFRRLLRLAGSRWRYSTPPPHGFKHPLTLCSSLNVTDQVSHPYESIGKSMVLSFMLLLKKTLELSTDSGVSTYPSSLPRSQTNSRRTSKWSGPNVTAILLRICEVLGSNLGSLVSLGSWLICWPCTYGYESVSKQVHSHSSSRSCVCTSATMGRRLYHSHFVTQTVTSSLESCQILSST
jgi:hypothetical protein